MEKAYCKDCNLTIYGTHLNYCAKCGRYLIGEETKGPSETGTQEQKETSSNTVGKSKFQHRLNEALEANKEMDGRVESALNAGDLDLTRGLHDKTKKEFFDKPNKRIEELPMAEKCDCLGRWPLVNGRCVICGLQKEGVFTSPDADHDGKLASNGGAMRFNKLKPDYTQIDFESLLPMVNTLMFGEVKYARANWRNGGDNMSKVEILKSLSRHVAELTDAVNRGDETGEIDPETLEHLIGNIMCNGMFYAYHHVYKNKKYDAVAIYKRWKEQQKNQ